VPIVGARAQHRPAYRQFCTLLRAWRLEAGLTEREVAATLGKPHSFTSQNWGNVGSTRWNSSRFAERWDAIPLVYCGKSNAKL
jgi:hypothetical protein